ncbi:hypothetical protein [Stenotrophomonas pigmentata]|uniref:hypothetical protein n=1 Tax=Stenotrophomonas pigmentata TaxID=3055080 RepID=UPI0026EB27D4|nr:hypothetical protein [Stenotrophomonas sp. 610A2]
MHTQDNVYAPPQSSLAQETAVPSALPPFYVVSITKLVLLYVATMGFYSLYWFWKHWARHKRDKKLSIWPVPRAIFAIFFAHSLNQEIDHRLQRAGKRYSWSPGMWAGAYVISAIGGRIVSRIPETILPALPSFGIGILLLAINAMALVQAQRAANLACGDPDGSGNARLTAANWAWLILGGLFWLVIGLGIVALFWTPTVYLPAS